MKDHAEVGGRSHVGSDRALMRQTASLLATDLSLGELFERLTSMLPEYLDSSVVFIALTHPDGTASIEYIYDHGEIRRYPHIPIEGQRSRSLEVIRTGEVIWGNDPSVWAPEGSNPINKDRPWTNDTISAIFVPMRAGGATIGVLSVQSTRGGAYTPDDVEVVAAIGHYVGVAVENQRMYQRLQHTADHDPLTGLANYPRLAREVDWALRRASPEQPATLAVFDLVNFAAFNELYGYGEGDAVLKEVSQVLAEFADDQVVVGRFGADVFMLLRKASDPADVDTFVARVAARLATLSYRANGNTIPIWAACGYAVAPADVATRHALVSRCIDRARLSRQQACRPVRSDEFDTFALHGTFDGIETIVTALLDRDPYTRVHLFDVNALAEAWSREGLQLDADERAMFLQASFLHDAGKLLVSDRILVKPGSLTEAEFEAVRQHAFYGEQILAPHHGFERISAIVGQHHERWDGRGYPRGLKGEEISPLARAVSVIDVFSAMVADRPYHRGVSEADAIAELRRCAGTQFDPYYVEAFAAWRENRAPG